MYENGKISEPVLEKNLARVVEDVDPRITRLREAVEAGRITRDVYDANVRRILQERGVP